MLTVMSGEMRPDLGTAAKRSLIDVIGRGHQLARSNCGATHILKEEKSRMSVQVRSNVRMFGDWEKDVPNHDFSIIVLVLIGPTSPESGSTGIVDKSMEVFGV